MDVELAEKIVECLRGLEIGESIPADGIADEIGSRLGNVYDALDEMEREKLIVMHPAVMRGRDPTYTLTPKGKHFMEEVKPESEEKAPKKSALKVKKDKSRVYAAEPLVICPDCHKPVRRIGMHKKAGGCHPAPAIEITQESLPPKVVSDPVPPPSEYVDGFEMDGGTITPSEPVNAEKVAWTIDTFTKGYEDDEYPPQLQDIPTVEEILGQQQAAEDPTAPDEIPTPDDEIHHLRAAPGMSAVLRLLSCCQRAADEGADLSIDAHITAGPGFSVHIAMDIPAKEEP